MLTFAVPPNVQGNPSEATAAFLFPEGPAAWLEPGRVLSLLERATGERARVEVLD